MLMISNLMILTRLLKKKPIEENYVIHGIDTNQESPNSQKYKRDRTPL